MVKAVFGGGSFIEDGTLVSFNTTDKVAEAIEVLLASGVTTIDTARIYPGSEAAIGKQEKRTQFDIDTKIPGGLEPDTANKDTIVEHVKEALQKVNIKQFDILYIHCPDPDIPLADTLAGINEAHKQGFFKRFGLSNYAPQDVQRVYDLAKEKGYPLPEVYQGNYNPVARHLEKDLFPVLRELGIIFYAYSPLAGGFLTKSAADLDAGAGRFNDEALGGMYSGMYDKPALREGLKEWSKIAEKEGLSKAELAYKWVAHHSALTEGDGVIFGASKLSQIEQTAANIKNGKLSDEAVKSIDHLWETVKAEAPVDNYIWFKGSKA
ncbi:aflatoxin B1 aldehyde reductase-like protein member 2 [Macroventuria anomochaeta]|uniref:Aflatoxin B1 aldehyde reductase-like protein member 2 n=1 Tax=Macroventuria anomochaeta TaxID=301207 RepID=A0ACB6RXU0_9PLEO|nr:aflatoxin B1 aldehyde reductase-like protein member 2 [Macroventuria anomochaeta]KAF2626686.1 aflatoxin B1 aldehyde reductase-like protein member 2 [Macroventuria anomochaeta]